MKYCRYCGAQLRDEAVVCPKCGCPTKDNSTDPNPAVEDKEDVALNLISVFIPLVGLILYCVWHKMPKRAAGILRATAIGFVLSVVAYVVLFFAWMGYF